MAAKKPAEQITVKASITIGVRDHALWGACASLSRMDRSAFAVAAIKAACSGLILVDRRRPAGQAKGEDRLAVHDPVSSEGPETAA